MSKIKTGLMYSPLTERIFWGRMNVETGVRVGKEPADVTSDFIGVMLKKFPINTSQAISCNGEAEATVIVLDKEKSHKYLAAKELYEALENLTELAREAMQLANGNGANYDSDYDLAAALKALAKARGEL